MAAILLAKIFSIQVLDDHYKIDADNNTTVREIIYPTRGVIYDRNGAILVGNKVAYDILVNPRDLEKVEFDTVGVTMIKQIPAETYNKFAEVQYRFPGFKGQVRGIRDYPINAGGNLLGYVSEVDQSYMDSHPGEYRSGDYAGKTGIEAAREKDLRGEKGYHIFLRNSKNQIEQPYKDGEFDKEAVPGHDIVTTIDAKLQQYGQELMKNKVGAIVAIEPGTGEILSLVSSPGIDVNQLADIGKYYQEILADPYRPMYNRAVQASYPPGSVFKLVNGLVGLEEGVLRPEMMYPCSHGYHFGAGHKLGCHGHKSPLNMEESIMMSCNAYYCYVLKNILDNRKFEGDYGAAMDHWHEMVTSFGFGTKLGSDFPNELSGSIPTSKTYNRARLRQGPLELHHGHFPVHRPGRDPRHADAPGEPVCDGREPRLLLHSPHHQGFGRCGDRPEVLREAVHEGVPGALPEGDQGHVAGGQFRRGHGRNRLGRPH